MEAQEWEIDVEYDKAKADEAVKFIENLKHSVGQWAGKRFLLADWQKKIIRKIFGTINKDGKRQYRTVYIEVPRAFQLPLPYGSC